MNRMMTAGVVALAGAALLQADFSYEQTSKMTGGAMMGMMKMMGAINKQMREPVRTTFYVKGDRMATYVGDKSAHIVDVGKETVTEINFEKRTYSVMTFAQFAQMLQKMQERMSGKDKEQKMEFQFDVSVKDTGESKVVNGLNARQMIMIMTMKGKDKESGKEMAGMAINNEMWIAPKMAGYQEVRDLQMRMAQKLNWNPGGTNMFMQRPDMAKGMANMAKEMAKLDGVPVLMITKMGGPAGQPGETPEGASAPPPQQEQQAQEQPAEKPSIGGALGRLGGGRLGLGGFGRKKKQEQQQEQQPQQESAPAARNTQGGSASLMEMTTELTSFSSAAVDGAKFDVPAGFKEVQPDIK